MGSERSTSGSVRKFEEEADKKSLDEVAQIVREVAAIPLKL